MDYRNCEKNTEGACTPPAPIESLTNMVKETNCMAADVLAMTRRINGHLFGIGNPCCEKEADPKCFRDELAAIRCELLATAEELSKICTLIGV